MLMLQPAYAAIGVARQFVVDVSEAGAGTSLCF